MLRWARRSSLGAHSGAATSSRCSLFLVNSICSAAPGSDFVFIYLSILFLCSVFDQARRFKGLLTIKFGAKKEMDGFQKEREFSSHPSPRCSP